MMVRTADLDSDGDMDVPTPGCMSLIIIEPAIQEPPALPTSPVVVSTATMENVANTKEFAMR